MVPSARPNSTRTGTGGDPRARPVPWPGTGARAVLFGAARHPAAAEPREHLQGAGERPRRQAGTPRVPRSLGEAGRAAAEQRAHRRDGPRRLAPRARLGALHRPHYQPCERQAQARRVYAVGQLCAEEGGVCRYVAAPGAEGAAPLTAVGAQRLFRLQAFFQGERVPSIAGAATLDWTLPEP